MHPTGNMVRLDDYEEAARAVLNEMAFEYLASGSGDDITLRRNRSSLDAIALLPRVLVDVSTIDTRVTLFGRQHASPILLAPTGYHKLFHPEGELETVRGADLGDTTLIAASFSNVAFAEMTHAAQRPLWFQLYVQTDRGFTRDLVERVIRAGCEAICVTVDLPVNSVRDREQRSHFNLPPHLTRANLAELGRAVSSAPHQVVHGEIHNAVRASDFTWKDLEWLRSITSVPLLVKGISRPADARTALSLGCDGIIVSNHGGRSVDGLPASIDLTRRIAGELPDGKPLLMDGGIRRGTDIFKALACGASAVLIGRPYLYALAVGGAQAIAHALGMLRAELGMTMGLCGTPSIRDIDRSFLQP